MGNKIVVLIGAGYSVTNGIELGLWEKIKGLEVWSLNYAFMTMPFLPDKEFWVDVGFFKNNFGELQNLQKKGVKLITKIHNHYAILRKANIINEYGTTREAPKYHGKEAISKNEIYTGRMGLVGLFALSFAVASGYNNIILCGYDFGTKTLANTNTHYYQYKLKKIISSGVCRPQVYLLPDGRIKREVKDFELCSKEKDVNIWNVSPESNIPYFEKIDYPKLFKKLGEWNG